MIPIIFRHQDVNYSFPYPEPSNNYTKGQLVYLSKSDYDQFIRTKGKDILAKYKNIPFYYNEKKNIVIIDKQYCKNAVDICSLISDCLIWTCIDLSDPIPTHFGHPYSTEFNPMKQRIPLSIGLIYDRSVNHAIKPKKLIVSKEGYCSMMVRVSDQTIAFLKQTPHQGYGRNQKEIAGDLHIHKIIDADQPIYEIDLIKDSISSGEEESITINYSRFNFHSHPKLAYENHNVNYAWFSLQDFFGFLQLGDKTICHLLASLEGLYVLCFSHYWSTRIKQIDKKFIKQNYDIKYNQSDPQKFIQLINSIKLNGHPIFIVRYFPWHIANTPFDVYFSKQSNCCALSENILNVLH